MTLNNETLQDFYLKCIDQDKQRRIEIAEEYGIPRTKASNAYYQGQELMYDKMCKDLNIGKGSL